MKKRRKEKDNNTLIILGIIVFAIIISIVIAISGNDNKTEEKVFEQEGYVTTDEDAFYKKIVTNNTLDDYYNDISSNRDTAYEEYYFSKDSYDFIELKMSYNNQVNRILNITSDLTTDKVEYNYEISYQGAQLLIEGNSDNNYDCNIIVKKNILDEDAREACNEITNEISTFLGRKDKLLQNKKVQEILNQPMKQYIEE